MKGGCDIIRQCFNLPAMCSPSPGLHSEELLPIAAQLLQLPQVLLHVRQRGHLPRHPGPTAAAGRRHPQRLVGLGSMINFIPLDDISPCNIFVTK